MRTAWVIANREYKRYFTTPAAYAVAFMLLLIIGILFYVNILGSLVSGGQFAPGVEVVLNPMVFLMIFVAPAITMHLIAEEHSIGTIELMFTSPIKDWEFVVGKWLGSFLFVATLVLFTLIYPLVLNFMVSPGIDQGPLISGYLGALLVCMALVAIGTAVSSMFSNTVASFFVTLGIMLGLWIMSALGQSAAGTPNLLLEYIDFRGHFYSTFLTGVIDLRDIVYYLSMTIFFLFLGSVVVETRRWR
jgi:ABC-2 type transport system permease protein